MRPGIRASPRHLAVRRTSRPGQVHAGSAAPGFGAAADPPRTTSASTDPMEPTEQYTVDWRSVKDWRDQIEYYRRWARTFAAIAAAEAVVLLLTLLSRKNP